MDNIGDVSVTPNIPVNPYSKQDSDKSAKDDFMALMAGSMDATANMGSTGVGTMGTVGDIDVNKELETKVSVNGNVKQSVKENIKPATENKPKVTEADSKKVEEETKEFVKGVKKLLTKELDISEEELTSAMENLGLSMMDLTEPKNLALLLNEIKGEDAGISLLLDTSVKNIFDGMGELTGELFLNTGLNSAEITEVLNLEGMEITTDVVPVDIDVADVTVPIDNGEINAETETEAADTNVPVNTTANAPVNENVTVKEETDNDTDTKVSTENPENLAAIREPERNRDAKTKETEIETETDIDNSAINALRAKVDNSETGSQSSFTGQNKGGNETGNTPQTVTGPDLTPDPVNNVQAPGPTFAEAMQELSAPTEVTSYTDVNTADVINQIVTSASTTITNDVRTMELMLNPQNLGRMLMQVSEQEGQVTARFVTQNESVKAALEGAIANLVEKLNEQGIKVDAVEVSVGTHEFEENLEKNFAGDAREDLQGGQGANTGEEGNRGNRSRGGIHLSDASYMEGAELTEAEELEASLMRTYGNTVNFTA